MNGKGLARSRKKLWNGTCIIIIIIIIWWRLQTSGLGHERCTRPTHWKRRVAMNKATNWKLVVVSLCMFVVALTPATVQALRGIFPGQNKKSFHDCKNDGYMAVEPDSNSTPVDLTDDYADAFVNGAGETEGRIGRKETTMDAATYAETEPFVEFSKGSLLGNGIFNGQPAANLASYPADASAGWHLDEAVAEWILAGECQDCPNGRFKAILKQRLWKKITVTWTAATTGQTPVWDVRVDSIDVRGNRNSIRASVALGTPQGHIKTVVDAHSNIVHDVNGQVASSDPHTANVDDGGDVGQTDGSGGGSGQWEGSSWNPDNSRTVTVEAFWDNLDRDQMFQCSSIADPKSDDIRVQFRHAFRVLDNNDPAGADHNLMSRLQAHLEYGSLLLLWRIDVTRNCDNSVTNCPCCKFQEANIEQPNSP
jgi:hypothetical protein